MHHGKYTDIMSPKMGCDRCAGYGLAAKGSSTHPLARLGCASPHSQTHIPALSLTRGGDGKAASRVSRPSGFLFRPLPCGHCPLFLPFCPAPAWGLFFSSSPGGHGPPLLSVALSKGTSPAFRLGGLAMERHVPSRLAPVGGFFFSPRRASPALSRLPLFLSEFFFVPPSSFFAFLIFLSIFPPKDRRPVCHVSLSA